MYVPSLKDILEGLHKTMETIVLPAIEDSYARGQATNVSAQLHGLVDQWEMIAQWASMENAEARGALTECLQALDEPVASPSGDLDTLRTVIRRALEQDYPPDQPPRSAISLGEEGQVLGRAMEQAILGLHRLQQTVPSRGLARAREALRRVIRVQADRRDPKLDGSLIKHAN